MKKYLLNRTESLSAWIGMLGCVLEIILHLGHVSLVMLLLFISLIITPEKRVRKLFCGWTASIKDWEMEKLKKFKIKSRVRYIPPHAHGDPSHPDCKDGAISSIGENSISVKFDTHVARHGWDSAAEQECDPEDLFVL